MDPMIILTAWAIVFAIALIALLAPDAFRRAGVTVILVIAFVMLVLVLAHKV